MATPIVIRDGSGNGRSQSIFRRDGIDGSVVYTDKLYQPVPSFLPLVNGDNGADMNIDASAGGTPVNIHDGIDNVYWTGSSVVGTSVTFNSTDRASAGTQSVRANSPSVGDIWEFDKGSDQDLSSYVSISGKANINRRWTTGDSVSMYGWRAGAQVGDKVLMEDYLNISSNDVWQGFVVPLTDMGLDGQTIDTIRFQQEAANGQTPDWFLDEFKIEETGSAVEYKTNKTRDKDYEVYEFLITMVDNVAGTLTNGAGQIPLTYNALLGVSALGTGITIRNVKDDVAQFSANFTGVIDFLSAGFEISDSGSDGTNSFLVLKQRFIEPIILSGPPNKNYISATINDDLSGLVKLTMALRGGEIERS